MKIKEGFVLRTVAGENVVIPSGDNMDLSVMMTLNDTGRFLWEQLETEKTQEQLLAAVLAEYDVSAEIAGPYIAEFVEKLGEYGCLA